MIHPIGLEVLRDIAAVEPDFALAVDLGVSLLEAGLAGPEAFDLGASQDDPGLDRLHQVVLEAGPAVARDDLDRLFVGLLALRFFLARLRHHRRTPTLVRDRKGIIEGPVDRKQCSASPNRQTPSMARQVARTSATMAS